jgi:glycosyltransferase involved in cell wall biosynthesis
LSQSCLPNEIIVVDDGSTDDTSALMTSVYPEIVFIQQSNTGVSCTRNVGIKRASGDWIAFLDSDDEWLPRKLEKQINELKSGADYKVCHTEELWVRNGVRVNQMKKHKKSGGWIFPQCLPLCAMSPSSILINHSVFEDIGDFDTTLPACEDYDLWLRITAKYPVLYIEAHKEAYNESYRTGRIWIALHCTAGPSLWRGTAARPDHCRAGRVDISR